MENNEWNNSVRNVSLSFLLLFCQSNEILTDTVVVAQQYRSFLIQIAEKGAIL